MKVTKIILPVALSLTILSQAQQKPVQVAHPVFFSKSSPLRELDPVPPGSYFDGPTEVIEFIKAPHREVFTELPEGFPDPVIQDFMGVRGKQLGWSRSVVVTENLRRLAQRSQEVVRYSHKR